MATKTYVLLDALDVDAPIYQQIPGGQRSKITKIPWHRPFLDIQVEDEKGESRRLRYKATSKYLFADDQLTQLKIEANAKFTDTERNETYFRHGILTTNKEILQNFLEANPEYDKSIYTSDSVKKRCYRLLDKATENKIKNADLKARVKAAAKIVGLDLKAAQEMIIRLNGSAVVTPDDVDECQNMLMEFLDAHEEAGIEAIMKEDITTDEKTRILIGKLMNSELLVFDVASDKILKKDKAGKDIVVREITAPSQEERERLFGNFLDTEEGKALRSDLEKDLSAFEKKQNSKDKT